MTKRAVEVSIAGQTYRVRSDADEEWLQHVASCVDETMAQIRDRTGMVDTLDIAVLTSLNLARDLLTLREEQDEGGVQIAEDRMKVLIDLAESALERHPLPEGGADGRASSLLSLQDVSEDGQERGLLGPIVAADGARDTGS